MEILSNMITVSAQRERKISHLILTMRHLNSVTIVSRETVYGAESKPNIMIEKICCLQTRQRSQWKGFTFCMIYGTKMKTLTNLSIQRDKNHKDWQNNSKPFKIKLMQIKQISFSLGDLQLKLMWITNLQSNRNSVGYPLRTRTTARTNQIQITIVEQIKVFIKTN